MFCSVTITQRSIFKYQLNSVTKNSSKKLQKKWSYLRNKMPALQFGRAEPGRNQKKINLAGPGRDGPGEGRRFNGPGRHGAEESRSVTITGVVVRGTLVSFNKLPLYRTVAYICITEDSARKFYSYPGTQQSSGTFDIQHTRHSTNRHINTRPTKPVSSQSTNPLSSVKRDIIFCC